MWMIWSHLYFSIQGEMAATKFLFLAICLISCSFSFAKEQSLESLLNETTSAVHHAKEHISHMLALPTPKDHQKVVDSVKNARDHFTSELESHSYELHVKASGNHNGTLTQVANQAAEHFNNSANTLRGLTGSDLKQQNDEYFKAADLVLQEAKNLIAAGPCDEISPIIRGALTELKQDSDHYQDILHSAVGSHGSQANSDAGHHGHGNHDHGHEHSKGNDFSHAASPGHHAHQNHHHYHGKSSEESSEEKH